MPRCVVGDHSLGQNATSTLVVVGGTWVVVGTPMTAIIKRLVVANQPDLSLVELSPAAQTALTYARGALCNPVSLSVMAFAVCVGVGYAGVLGAVVAMIAFVALGTAAT